MQCSLLRAGDVDDGSHNPCRQGNRPTRRAGVAPFLLALVPLFVLQMMLLPVPASSARLSFVLDAPASRQEEARLIAAQLADAGIDARVVSHEPSALRSKALKGLGHAYLTDWGSSFFDPFDLAVPKLATGSRDNYSSYSNPRVDELLSVAASSMHPEERARAYREVQEIIFLQTPWVFGYVAPRFEAVSPLVQNYAPALDGRINLHDVWLLEGDTLVVALDTDAILSLDPAAYRSRETETVIRNLYDGLVTRAPDGRVVLELAESYTQTDSTIHTFKLRHGPCFHNGDPVTSDDVVFTFQRILNPYGIQGSPSPRRNLLGPLERVEAVGSDEVRFILERPFPLFLQALTHFQIVSRKHMGQGGGKGFQDLPVGTGPFRFVSGSLDTEIILERFESYYGGSPDLPPVGPAKAHRVVFRPLPDEERRLAVLAAGGAHIVQGVSSGRIKGLESSGIARVLDVEGTRANQIELNNAQPPFNDIRARKALSLAIDWKAILQEVYHGFGQPLATCFLPIGFGFHAELAPVAPDLEAARRLLESAGYDVAVSDGKGEQTGMKPPFGKTDEDEHQKRTDF